MIEYFTLEDLQQVQKQRKNTLIIFFAMLTAYLFICAGFVLWYLTLPYHSSTITLLKIAHYAITLIAIVIMSLFLGIKYKRVNKFYRISKNLINAINETWTGSFIGYDETVQDKDGVEFKSLVFLEWNKYKNEFFERKVLVFNEREFPEIPEDANVKYVTQSNILLRYEIL